MSSTVGPFATDGSSSWSSRLFSLRDRVRRWGWRRATPSTTTAGTPRWPLWSQKHVCESASLVASRRNPRANLPLATRAVNHKLGVAAACVVVRARKILISHSAAFPCLYVAQYSIHERVVPRKRLGVGNKWNIAATLKVPTMLLPCWFGSVTAPTNT